LSRFAKRTSANVCRGCHGVTVGPQRLDRDRLAGGEVARFVAFDPIQTYSHGAGLNAEAVKLMPEPDAGGVRGARHGGPPWVFRQLPQLLQQIGGSYAVGTRLREDLADIVQELIGVDG